MSIETITIQTTLPSPVEPIIINISLALTTLLIGLIIGKIINKLIKKLMKELEVDKYISKIIKLEVNLTNLISSTISFIIYLITIILTLNQLGITNILLSFLIALLSISLIGSLILSTTEFFPNLFYGFEIRKKYKNKKNLKLGIVKGRIWKLNPLNIVIETKEKEKIYVPYTYIKENN